MEIEGATATFANGVEGAGNDLTLNFTQTATVDGFANVANFTSLGGDLNGTFTTSGSRITPGMSRFLVIQTCCNNRRV